MRRPIGPTAGPSRALQGRQAEHAGRREQTGSRLRQRRQCRADRDLPDDAVGEGVRGALLVGRVDLDAQAVRLELAAEVDDLVGMGEGVEEPVAEGVLADLLPGARRRVGDQDADVLERAVPERESFVRGRAIGGSGIRLHPGILRAAADRCPEAWTASGRAQRAHRSSRTFRREDGPGGIAISRAARKSKAANRPGERAARRGRQGTPGPSASVRPCRSPFPVRRLFREANSRSSPRAAAACRASSPARRTRDRGCRR